MVTFPKKSNYPSVHNFKLPVISWLGMGTWDPLSYLWRNFNLVSHRSYTGNCCLWFAMLDKISKGKIYAGMTKMRQNGVQFTSE